MLKWLVTRGPSPPMPKKELVTDDPLATIRLKNLQDHQQIYAVSRVNPLFEEEAHNREDDSEIIHPSKNELQNHTEEPFKFGQEHPNRLNNNVPSTSKDTLHHIHLNTNEHDGNNRLVDKRSSITQSLPESPPGDRSSIKSSGYGSGSKGTNSISDNSDVHSDELNSDTESSNIKVVELNESNSRDWSKKENVLVKNSNVTQSVAELRRSFEDTPYEYDKFPTVVSTIPGAIVTKNTKFIRSIELGMRRAISLDSVREPYDQDKCKFSTLNNRPEWPRVSHLAQALQRQSKNIERNRRRFQMRNRPIRKHNPPIFKSRSSMLKNKTSTDIVSANKNYVTSINFPNNLNNQPESTLPRINTNVTFQDFEINSEVDGPSCSSIYFGNKGTQHTSDFPLLSLQPDSLINDDILKLMNYSKSEEENEYREPITVPTIPEFNHVMYTRGLYATLNRAISIQAKEIVKPPRTKTNRDIYLTNNHISAKRRGMSTVKELWEKSGLKTNGRKLIVTENENFPDDIFPIGDDPKKQTSETSSRQFRSFNSNLVTVNKDIRILENGTTSSGNSSHTYEDVTSLDNPSYLSNNKSFPRKYSGSQGIDNPAFENDHQTNISNKNGNFRQSQIHLQSKQSTLENDFDKNDRRVKFSVSNRRHSRSNGPPGQPVRKGLKQIENTRLRGSHSSAVSGKLEERRGIWTTSESYRNRLQDPIPAEKPNGPQNLWESYYGSIGDSKLLDHTLPRPPTLQPHPNSEALNCEGSATCQDFTLDMDSLVKLKKQSASRKKHKSIYTWVIVTIAFVFFIAVIVAISWYCTNGQRIFGPM